MRDIDGRALVPRHRVKGKHALERRLRGLLLAVERFGKHRARTGPELAWSATLIAWLLAALEAAERAAAPDDSENGSEKGQTPCQP
jgi:hypothetical protein